MRRWRRRFRLCLCLLQPISNIGARITSWTSKARWLMPASFAGNGFRFLYPENWKLEEQATENGGSVTLQSPGTGFMFVTFDRNRPAVEDVLETTLAALRDDYPELESESVTEKIASRQARGYDV